MPEALCSNKSRLFRDHSLAPDSDKTVSPRSAQSWDLGLLWESRQGRRKMYVPS